MAISYFNEVLLEKKRFSKNHFRVRKIRNKYLITTDQGSWVALDKKEYQNFMRGNLDNNLFKILEEKGVILTPNNMDQVLNDYRQRFSGVFRGTSLHIITPTIRCNQKCGYCHSNVRSKLSNEKYDMSKETAKKTLEFIFQTPEKSITIEFQGGEALLRPDLVKYIVEEAKRMNKKYNKTVRFALVSNLTVMTDELLEWIMKENIGLCTSLDGPKELHDKNRWFEGGGASYDEVVAQIKKIKEKYGHPPGMLMVTTKYSLPYWKEIVDEYVKFGQKSLQLKYMNKLGFAEHSWDQISCEVDEFFDFWKKSLDYMIQLNKKGVKIRERFVTLILQKIITKNDPNFVDWSNPSGEIHSVLAYDHKGDIFASDEGRMNEMFTLGNVHTHDYKEILSSDKSQQLIGASINDNYAICDSCAYKPWCGIDPVMVHAEQGNIIPKISNWSKHKVYEFQFNYVFDKLLFDSEVRGIFFDWLTNWGGKGNSVDDIERIIKEKYGIDVEKIEKVKNGAMNLGILIKNKTERKLLKGYFNWFKEEKENKEFVKSIIRWITFLNDRVDLFGPINNTKEGRGYLKINNNFAILHDYVDGGVFGGTKKETENTAKILAQIHTELRNYKEEMHTRKFRKNIEGDGELIKLFISKYPEMKKFFEKIEKEIEKISKELKKRDYTQLENIYIHGDFSMENLIYENGKMKAIVDFDSIMYGPKIFDLAVFLSSLIAWNKNYACDFIKVFYNEYKKNIDLNEMEKQLVVPFMQLYIIKQIISRLKREDIKGKEIAELISGLNWIDRNQIKLKKYLN